MVWKDVRDTISDQAIQGTVDLSGIKIKVLVCEDLGSDTEEISGQIHWRGHSDPCS